MKNTIALAKSILAETVRPARYHYVPVAETVTLEDGYTFTIGRLVAN